MGEIPRVRDSNIRPGEPGRQGYPHRVLVLIALALGTFISDGPGESSS